MNRIVFFVLLGIGGLVAMFVVDWMRTDRAVIDQNAELIRDAVALVENENPVNQDDPRTLAFRKKYPSVLGMTTDDGSNQRFSIIYDGANREHIDERYDPPKGKLYFSDGSSKPFVEFRIKCRIKGQTLNLKIKVLDSGSP